MYKAGFFTKNNAKQSEKNVAIEFPKNKLRKLPTAMDIHQLQNKEIMDAQKLINRIDALMSNIQKPSFFAAPKPSPKLPATPKPSPRLFAAPKSNIIELEIKNRAQLKFE